MNTPPFLEEESNDERNLYRLFLNTLNDSIKEYNKLTFEQISKKYPNLFWIEDPEDEPYVEPEEEQDDSSDDMEFEIEALRVTDEDDEADELEEKQYDLDSINKEKDLKQARTKEEKILIKYTYARNHQDILFVVSEEMEFAGYDFWRDIDLRYNLFYTRCEQYL